MKSRTVKDIMLPLDEYAVVLEDTTLEEALSALDKSQVSLPPDRQPHRAVLIKDRKGKIVGKLGHLGFLRALEPKYNTLGDVERLSKAGVNLEFMNMMMDNLSFWQDDISIVCRRARTITMKDVMKPVEENIDENASLGEAIHRMVMWQILSILVTRGDEVVGILRLSDLFDEVSNLVKSPNDIDE